MTCVFRARSRNYIAKDVPANMAGWRENVAPPALLLLADDGKSLCLHQFSAGDGWDGSRRLTARAPLNRELCSDRPVACQTVEQFIVVRHENRDVLIRCGDAVEPAQLRHHRWHVFFHPGRRLASALGDVVHDPGGVDAVQDLASGLQANETQLRIGAMAG